MFNFYILMGGVAVLAMMQGVPLPASVDALITFYPGWKSRETQMLSQAYFRFGFLNASDTFRLAVYLQFESDTDWPVVWSAANVDSSLSEAGQAPTLQSNAFLEAINYSRGAAAEGSFILRLDDGSDRTVWQVEGVRAMDLKDDGNLVLYNQAAINQTAIVWQSFDHPTNTLLKGQSLYPGRMQLTSSSGDYSSVLYPGGLIGLANHVALQVPGSSSTSLPYWFVSLNGSFDNGNFSTFGITDIQTALSPPRVCSRAFQPNEELINATLVRLFLPINQSMPGFELQYSACGSVNLTFYVGSSVVSVDFVTLQDNGYLKAFNVLNGSGLNALAAHTQPGGLISFPFSPISNYVQEPLFPCDVPNACTSYGICVPGSQLATGCKCPSAASLDTTLFQQVGQGCEPANRLPIGCVDRPQSVTFVEIQKTTFISMLISGWNYSTLPLTACLDLCRNNCSCVAVFFQHNTSLCLPVSRMMGLLAIDDSNFSAYLKIPVSAGHRFRLIFLTALLLLLPMLAAFVALWWFYCRRQRSESDSDESTGSEDVLAGANFEQVLHMLPAKFSYRELKNATDGFSKKLGGGAFGSVYEGTLADGRRAAVKKLKGAINKGTKQFLAEVATIGRVDHVHVVRLFGFCLERSHSLLVYECMPNGSLDKWLFSKRLPEMASFDAEATDDQCLHFLDWKMRLNIAVGAAMGLSYLHNECTEPILHLDIKSQNILLDSNLMPKLSDFGMSRLIDREASCVVTQARGTPGYMAPELFLHSMVTRKCDVYSLGMVLLELVCGRRIYDPRCTEAEYLPEWVMAKHREGKLTDVVDRCLMETPKYDPQEAQRIILTALWCILPEPALRPSAGALVRLLTGDDPVEDPPSTKGPQMQISFEDSSQVSTASSLWSLSAR